MVRNEHNEENEAFAAPSPFQSSTEREFLTSVQLSVPTAVPVDDFFEENLVPAAVAVAAPAAVATIPDEEDPKSIDEDIIVKPEPDGATNLSHLPAAHAIQSAGSLIQQQHTASAQLRAANLKGVLSSEEEMASIARAHRGVPDMQREADEAIRNANIAAHGKKGKKDEGLAVDHMIHHLNVKCSLDGNGKKEDEDNRLYGTTYSNGKRGYEIKEYETSNYETTEYETTEYKSVYD